MTEDQIRATLSDYTIASISRYDSVVTVFTRTRDLYSDGAVMRRIEDTPLDWIGTGRDCRRGLYYLRFAVAD